MFGKDLNYKLSNFEGENAWLCGSIIMSRILNPISKEEFASMFAKVRPPPGWSKNVGMSLKTRYFDPDLL